MRGSVTFEKCLGMLPIGGVLGMNLLLSSEQGSLSYNLNLDAIALGRRMKNLRKASGILVKAMTNKRQFLAGKPCIGYNFIKSILARDRM